MIKPILALLVIGGVLAGCAGQPNVYYTLTANEQGQASTEQRALDVNAAGLYTLSSVAVPAPVDDTMLVVRRSDDQLMKLAHDRWTAPLGKQVDNALAVALTHVLGMPPLSRSQAAGNARVVTRFSVDIQRFDLVPGQYAALAVLWQLKRGAANQTSATLTCYTELRQPVDPGVAPLVQAQQQNIAQLAQAMAAVWQRGDMPASTRCQ